MDNKESKNVPKNPPMLFNGNKSVKPAAPKINKPIPPVAKPPATPNSSTPKSPSGQSKPRHNSPNRSGMVKTASINKEAELKNIVSTSSNKKFTKQDKKIIEEQSNANYKIDKKRKKIKSAKVFAVVSGLPAARGLAKAKYYGARFIPVKNARRRAIAALFVYSNKKKRRGWWLILLLILLIIFLLGTTSYFITQNFIKSSINEKEIEIDPNFETSKFSDPVYNYMLGDVVERGLKVRNTNEKKGIWVAYKMEVTDSNGNPVTQTDLSTGMTSKVIAKPNSYVQSDWSTMTDSYNNTYYVSTRTVGGGKDTTLVLFANYVLVSNTGSYNSLELAEQTLTVTVTILVMEPLSDNPKADIMNQFLK